MASNSFLIKGGTIIDGSGAPMAKGNVSISGEFIKNVGNLGRSSAPIVIDATGKYIMPGIVDITNHSDTHWTLFTFPEQANLIAQGITTIVGGVCGASLAPLADTRALKPIRKWTDISRANINWQSVGEFLTELETRHKIGVNFGTCVGYNTLRANITPDSAQELTRPEIDSIKMMLKRSFEEGALGLSFNLAHTGNSTSTQDEIIEIARSIREANKITMIHMRNEGSRLLPSLAEVLQLARQSGAHIHISHFKAIGRRAWGDFLKALIMIRKAQKAEKLRITVDFFPYLSTGSLLYSLLPDWILEGDTDTIMKTLSDPSRKTDILDSLKAMTLHYDAITIAEAQKDKHAVGKTIAEIAHTAELSPEETMLELLITNGLGVTIFSKTLKSKHIVRIAKESYSVFASDGVGEMERAVDLTHPRSYGATARFLNRAVAKNGILSWEEAVKKMTFEPASFVGLSEKRGLVRPGYYADLVIFDPGKIKDRATYKTPYQYPEGIEYVFINGNCALEPGKLTGTLAGKILRGK